MSPPADSHHEIRTINRDQDRPRRRPSSLTYPDPRGSESAIQTTASPEEYFVLTCGGEVTCSLPDPSDSRPWGSPHKFDVPILPLPLEDPHTSQTSKRISTGCGARIHIRASPQGPTTWVGSADATGPTVVPLPEQYFTAEQISILGGGPKAKRCGCITSGAGCRVCGNTLGVQRTFCSKHVSLLNHINQTSYTFLAEAVSPPLPLRKKPIVVQPAPRPESSLDLSWLGLNPIQRTTRPRSPTHSELVGMGIRGEVRAHARAHAEEDEAAIERMFTHDYTGISLRTRSRRSFSEDGDFDDPIIVEPGLDFSRGSMNPIRIPGRGLSTLV
ncbi:hypothetical protein DFH06DRAFT_1349464 [Mycena polygramma]|nr:hypothetical protein DFH06DRAFT_1349464 [Mycena polygramma]